MLSPTNATGRSRVALGLVALLVLFGCSHDTLGPTLGLDSLLEGELELSPSELIINDAASSVFTVRLIRPDGSVRNLGSGATLDWTSSAPGIASVASSGMVTAKLPGVAEVRVHMGDRTASAPVVVLPLPSDLRPMFDGVMTGAAGASLSDSVAVRVVDRGGLPVSGIEVVFGVELGAGAVSPQRAVTDGAGIARTQWRLGDSAGDNALTARVPGLDDLLLRARGEGSDTDHRLELVGGDLQIGTVDEPLGQSLAVRVVDHTGRAVANANVRWIVDHGTLTSPGGGSGSALRQMVEKTDGTGVSQISWTLSDDAGTNQARAVLDTGAEKWFKAEAKAGGVATLTVDPVTMSLGQNASATLSAVALDRFGNPAKRNNMKWKTSAGNIVSVTGAGVVRGLALGQATITASAGKISGTATVTVGETAATSMSVEGGNGQSAPVGTTLPAQLEVVVHGNGGVALSGVIVTWAVMQGDGSLSATSSTTDAAGLARVSYTTGPQAGVNQVSATSGGLSPLTFTSTGVSGSIAGVSVTPTSTSLAVGSTKQLLASALDGSGNAVAGGTFQWSSADPGVASVDSNGLVSGVSVGITQVVVANGSFNASATVTVSESATRVVLDSSAATINAIGYTTRFTARAYGSDGTELPNANITWNTLTPGVASVDQLGRVVSQAVGTALISASLACCQGDTAVVDSRQVLAGVTLAPSAPAVNVGHSLQMQAMAVDSNNVAMSGSSVGWASSSSAVAPISPAGVVAGTTVGTAVITADVTPPAGSPDMSTRTLSSTLTVTDNPGPPQGFVAELPRQYVDTAEPATTRDIRLAANGDLQSAINSAQRGDRILLTPGAIYGDVTLPQKSGSGWVVIQTDISLPTGRMTAAKASSLNLAVIEGGAANSPVVRVNGDVSFYRIQGVVIRANSSVTELGELVAIATDRTKSTLVQPSNVILDRTYIHGNPPALQLKRCVQLSGQNVAVTNSSLLGCSKLGQDSQAIWVFDGLGPTAILNNHLQAGSEVFMAGGADPHIAGLVPSDMEIRGNYFHRPLSWKDAGIGVIKNLFELKNAQRVLLEGNVLEGNWSNGQSGWSILIKSTNQSGGCNWCTSDDITMRWNLIDDVENGVSIVYGNSTGDTHGKTERVVFENNVIARLGSNGNHPGWGSPLMILQMPGDVAIRSNTFDNAGGNHWLIGAGTGGPSTNFTVFGNVGWTGLYGVFVESAVTFPDGWIQGNDIIGGSGWACSMNRCPSSLQLQTVTIAGRSYSLPVSSNGGADLPQLAQRLQSVR